jgi:hypothetical protein
LLTAIFAPGQDDTLKQPVEHPTSRQQILNAAQSPRRRRLRHALQVRPPSLAEDNVQLPLLMAKSRHRSLRTLQRYARPRPDAVARADGRA